MRSSPPAVRRQSNSPRGEAALGIVAGAVAALVSAFAPASEAMQVAPTEAMSRGAHEHRARLRWRRGLAWSAVVAARLRRPQSQAPPWGHFPAGGYVAAFLAIGAAALATPAVVLAANRVDARLLHRTRRGMLAARSLTGVAFAHLGGGGGAGHGDRHDGERGHYGWRASERRLRFGSIHNCAPISTCGPTRPVRPPGSYPPTAAGHSRNSRGDAWSCRGRRFHGIELRYPRRANHARGGQSRDRATLRPPSFFAR